MSKLLLLVALACAVAYVQADAGIASLVGYANNDCTGTFTQTNFTTGDCKALSESYSYAFYFDSSNVYQVTFTGKNCTLDAAQAIVQLPTGCAKAAFATSWTTYGTSATPVFGSTFPPSGFTVTTSYVNVTAKASEAKASGCTAGNGQVQLQSASPFGKCTVRTSGAGFTTPSSTNVFCNSAGTMAGTVTFSDNTCTTSAVAYEQPIPTTCTISGNTATSPFTCGSAATFPSDLPQTSYSDYSDSGCKTLVSTTFLGSCFDSSSLTCGTVNGTDNYATYSHWTADQLPSGSANGACPATVTAKLVHQAIGGVCVQAPGSTKVWRMYSCTSSGPGASASTASVSIIATLFAAVAAVFAVRSL